MHEHTAQVFSSIETGVLYEFDNRNYSRTKPNVDSKGGYKVIKWGTDNLMPHWNRRVLAENDIKQELINTEVSIAAGTHLLLYKEVIEGKQKIKVPVIDPALDDWMEAFRVHEQAIETMMDLREHGNSWFEFILARDRSQVNSGMSLDAVDCRLRENAKGTKRLDTENLLVADWKYNQLKESDIMEVPLLDIRNPVLGKEQKVALHVKPLISGFPFYNLTSWYGTRKWTEIANDVPKFHAQALQNGYTIRYHIKIPMSMAEKIAEGVKEDGSKITISDAQSMIIDQFETTIKGADNSQKSFVSFINDKLKLSGEMMSEVKIEPIESNLNDESYLKLHDHASMVHARGHGLDPALSGFEAQGRLSAGSEIKNKLNFHIAYKTPSIRKLALKPFNLIKNFNFPDKKDIKIGFGDMDFTTLDESPSGVQPKETAE